MNNKQRILHPAPDRDLSAATPEGLTSSDAPLKEMPTPERTAARLALMSGVQQVLKNGLAVLGISAPDQM
jgi:arginyl-tRNA synthetase